MPDTATLPAPGPVLHTGKAKRVRATDDPALYLIEYTDHATAFNGDKHADIAGKGELAARISAHLQTMLERAGIPTHLVAVVDARTQLVRAVDIVPIEVVVRNTAAGSIVRRLGAREGEVFAPPLVELYLKDDDLGDPIITRDHARVLGIATDEIIDELEAQALAVNEALRTHLAAADLHLIDFKLEFGFVPGSGELLLADEVSPDTCRIHAGDGTILDKDRFRRDMGGLAEAYGEVWSRLAGLADGARA